MEEQMSAVQEYLLDKISPTCPRYQQGKYILPPRGINTCQGSTFKFVANTDLHCVVDAMHIVFQITAAFLIGILHHAWNECLGAESK